ncbi:MAG: hypothetical protein KGI09_07190 [Thaumarchaeota archaeon]|nr:hypothetical protein [Nitrososphaerota archaeon]
MKKIVTVPIIIVLVFSILVPICAGHQAHASGDYGCGFSLAPLDKVVYSPGDTVTIKAVYCQARVSTAKIVIADGMVDLNGGSPTLQDYEHGKNVIYENNVQSDQYGAAEVNFTIPQQQNTYRYVIIVSPTGLGGDEFQFFFTKSGAEKIEISDPQILNPTLNQGEILKVGAKITDGLGNPLPFFDFNLVTNYITCFHDQSLQNNVGSFYMSESERQNYFRTGMVWNWLQVPEGQPGTYSLNLTADAGDSKGFDLGRLNGLKYTVTGNTTIKNEMHLYPHYFRPDSYPAIDESSDVSPSLQDNHLIDFAIGDPLDLTEHAIHRGCVSFTNTMPVTVTVKKMQIDAVKAQNLFGTHPIGYDSKISCYYHPEICDVMSQNSTKFVRQTGDWFDIGQALDYVKKDAGEYLVSVNATYDNMTFDNAVDIRSHNVKEFDISAEGKKFPVFVDNWFSPIPANATFDEKGKSFALDLDTTANPKVVDITVPYDLLDGHLTVLVNGKQVLEGNDNNTYGMIKNDMTYSHITLFPDSNHTDVEIIGTSVVPEFLMPGIVLTIVVTVTVIVTYRLPLAAKETFR